MARLALAFAAQHDEVDAAEGHVVQQAHAALAGTRFTMSPGPPWWAAVPQHQWPAGLTEEFQAEEFLFAGGGADGGVVDQYPVRFSSSISSWKWSSISRL